MDAQETVADLRRLCKKLQEENRRLRAEVVELRALR